MLQWGFETVEPFDAFVLRLALATRALDVVVVATCRESPPHLSRDGVALIHRRVAGALQQAVGCDQQQQQQRLAPDVVRRVALLPGDVARREREGERSGQATAAAAAPDEAPHSSMPGPLVLLDTLISCWPTTVDLHVRTQPLVPGATRPQGAAVGHDAGNPVVAKAVLSPYALLRTLARLPPTDGAAVDAERGLAEALLATEVFKQPPQDQPAPAEAFEVQALTLGALLAQALGGGREEEQQQQQEGGVALLAHVEVPWPCEVAMPYEAQGRLPAGAEPVDMSLRHPVLRWGRRLWVGWGGAAASTDAHTHSITPARVRVRRRWARAFGLDALYRLALDGVVAFECMSAKEAGARLGLGPLVPVERMD